MGILKNPVWQFVGVMVAVVAIAVTVVLYYNGRPVKKLQVDILSNSPLISMSTDTPKEIQILYKAKPVQTLSLILLRLANTGTEPIKESDYSEPVRVSLSSSAEIGEVILQETRPDGIPLAPTLVAANRVELAKVLLNPGDQAVLKILALNNDATLEIKARIVGVRDLEIQSVLDRSNTLGDRLTYPFPNTVVVWVGLAIAGFVILAAVVWQSRSVMEWRRKRFGFDPANYFYTLAQQAMLTIPKSTEPGARLNNLNSAIRYLDRAFGWEISYIERAKKDPLFSTLQEYEPYKVVTGKHGVEK